MKPFIEKHLINFRPLTTYHALDQELSLKKDKNYLFDLSYLDVLAVQGDKALDFLQGQLTCDVRLVSDTRMVQGAQCNLKGRLLSLLDLVHSNGLKLILPKDLVESTLSSFSKVALLSRVSIEKNQQYKLFGFYLQNPEDLLPYSSQLPKALYAQVQNTEYCTYHLGEGYYIFIIQVDQEEAFCKPFIEHEQLLGSLTWHTLRLYQGQIDIYPESRALFLPHRLGLHQKQYISFNKGCYKGQEIIARTHYRATLKHELTLYKVDTKNNLYSGQKLLKPHPQIKQEKIEIGELIDYAPLGKENYLIAVSLLKEEKATDRIFFEGHGQDIPCTELT